MLRLQKDGEMNLRIEVIGAEEVCRALDEIKSSLNEMGRWLLRLEMVDEYLCGW